MKGFIIFILVTLRTRGSLGSSNATDLNGNQDVKIVGGEEVSPKYSLPYQLSLRYSGEHICGASIYNRGYAITAAHCAILESVDEYKVAAGKHVIGIGIAEPFEQMTDVSQIIVHPGYNVDTLVNDIALLKLSVPFKITDQVKPIKVPVDPLIETTGLEATVSGWGTLREGALLSNVLMKVTVPIVSDESCQVAYQDSMVVQDTMLCAGYDLGARDSCQGDSGGPLTVMDAAGKPLLVGIVSWGNGCAKPKYPGVYTDVAKFTSWIESHAGVQTI